MELTPYLQSIRDEVAATAEASGPEAAALTERLLVSTESALRLALLEALADAAAEISLELAPGSVDLRLRGREPEFVVTPAAPMEPPAPVDDALAAAWIPSDGDDASMTRINLRLPQDLKDRVEESARQAGLSVNAWLVRAAAAALPTTADSPRASRSKRGGDRYSGWVR
jgi:hypothetical protein